MFGKVEVREVGARGMSEWHHIDTAPNGDPVIVDGGCQPEMAVKYGAWFKVRYSEVVEDFIGTDEPLGFTPTGWMTIQQS